MEFFQFLVNLLKEMWPLRSVEGWEGGVLTVFARPRKVLTPGIYPVIPYIMDVHTASLAPAVVVTPLQTITLPDDTLLTFSASATVKVVDVQKAIFDVDSYRETTEELLAAVLAESLIETDVARFDTVRKRRNLLEELRQKLNEQTIVFGVEVQALRFSNMAINLRAYRLMLDSATRQQASW